MGAIVLPFLWFAQAMLWVAGVLVVATVAYLYEHGHPIAATLLALVVAFLLFACWNWGS